MALELMYRHCAASQARLGALVGSDYTASDTSYQGRFKGILQGFCAGADLHKLLIQRHKIVK